MIKIQRLSIEMWCDRVYEKILTPDRGGRQMIDGGIKLSLIDMLGGASTSIRLLRVFVTGI